MDIGEAVAVMLVDHMVAREGWNGKGMHIAMQKPDEDSRMTKPYIYMKTADGHFVPWLCSQTDLLATDWVNLGEAAPEAGEEEKAILEADQSDASEVKPAIIGGTADGLGVLASLLKPRIETIHKDSGVSSDVTQAIHSAIDESVAVVRG